MAENTIQPKVIFTEAYLNDPIKFIANSRFIPESALRTIESQSVALRDSDGFIFINTNTVNAQNYPVSMLLTVYNRTDFDRVIDREFNQLL